jgi:hypothetical protein
MEMWKHKFEIKKDRWVYVPSKEMIHFGRYLHKFLRRKWKSPLYYYHMRDGGHVAAAKLHVSNKYFSLIDIRNFFDSTSQSRVTRELKTIIPYEDARKVAKISTVRTPYGKEKKFAVPYGFPQSPILATLCLHNSYAGGVINRINKSGLVRVSVYMDDIILSGENAEIVQNEFNELCEALKKSRYEVNELKTQPVSEKISVFNLELSHDQLKVASKRMVQFIQAYAQSENEYERQGIAAYVYNVNPRQALLHFPRKS